MSTGYHIKDQEGAYYITLQVVGWIDVFSRQCYRDIIIENLKFCQQNKGLTIFAYAPIAIGLSNHIHILVQSQKTNLSNTIRDFKSYTSKVIIDAIETGSESRREWMLKQFKNAAKEHERNSNYQFWTHENHAEHIFTDNFVSQKLKYIHLNPVRAEIVMQPEHYVYSSATNYAGLESVLEVQLLTTKWKIFS